MHTFADEPKNKTGYRVNTMGKDVKNEDLFSNITSRFSGHTLLVDFGATWCAPCRKANIEIVKIKEKHKSKGIVFLYITGQSSPQATWENIIPDIHGEHFKLDDGQWTYLLKKFNILGIPFYVVVDKNGKVTYTKAGFPGNDVMKDELTKAIVK